MKTFILLLKVIRRQLIFTFYFKAKLTKEEFKKIKKIFFFSISHKSAFKSLNSLTNYIYFFYNNKNENSINPKPKQKEYLTNSYSIPKSNATFYLFDNKTKNLVLSVPKTTHYVGLPISLLIKDAFFVLRVIARNEIYFSKVLKIGKQKYFILERNNKQISRQTRRYIPYSYSRKTFMQHLFDVKINAVMLRWFDEIDHLGGLDEDIDVLIDNADIDNIDTILKTEVGILPLDLYSVDGEKNTDFAGLLYYPKPLSKAILEAKIIKNGFYIPSLYYYLVSIMYHAVFHKGEASGIPLHINSVLKNYKYGHDYNTIIKDLLKKNKLNISINLLSLYDFLKSKGYYPSFDLIVKLKHLKKKDIWFDKILSIAKEEIDAKYNHIKGFSVLFIREQGYIINAENCIEDSIKSFGFEIIKKGKISKDLCDDVNMKVRGGNWGNGPYAISGGYPKYYYILYDPFFVKPEKGLINAYPSLENKKIYILKKVLRAELNKLSKNNSFNGVHSSDDFYESVNYLEILGFSEAEISKIIQTSSNINLSYKSEEIVISNLSRHSARSKIELIEYEGSLAIKKTFNKYSSRFLRREIDFMKKFKDYNFVPDLYFEGDNYFISEYFKDSVALSESKHKLTKLVAVKLLKILSALHKEGYTLVDFNPSNVLYSNDELKLIDFEFAIEIEQPIKLIDSYDINKLPKNNKCDLPKGYNSIKDSYSFYWEPLIGLSKSKFVAIKRKF